MHVYAPGVQNYIPISWTIEPLTEAKTTAPRYPAAKTLHLPAIQETVPVFEGKFRIERDFTFPQQKTLQALAAPDGTLTVGGAFRYQACDDKICYTPVTVPLEWRFRVEAHDGSRVPEALRRR
ncbi:MAG: hypothetical protein KJZ79_10125 [Bryobacteraceae bacterium]|nr:hypothetical protein [Bryobacteraceae bacterium]